MTISRTNTFAIAFAVAIVLALGFVAFTAAPADATYFGGGCGEYCNPNPEPQPTPTSDVSVSSTNFGVISNDTSVTAGTGLNDANGGNAWKGGDAGKGGFIKTGDAVATANVTNQANYNLVEADLCGCEGLGDVTVSAFNSGVIHNGTSAGAYTGANDANGGSASGSSKSHHKFLFHYYGGGSSSDGGNGGAIWTGDATAKATVANIVNSNVTRLGDGALAD